MTPVQDRQRIAGQSKPRISTAGRRTILICIALFLIAVAATNPVLEMGVNDDWSYTRIAQDFALTGHLAYNGYAAAMLLPQIIWAAIFIKIFGFSFLVVRLSTVVLGVFLIPVLYYSGRESGLTPPFAAFVALLTALSPLMMPLTVSFMSDVPAVFFFAVCFYAGIKSWKATNTKTCIAWAGLVAVAGLLSGLDRQFYWLAPALFLPVIAWIQRARKGVAAGLGVLWLSAIVTVLYFVIWFQSKPYTLSEHTLDAWRHDGLHYLGRRIVSLTSDLGLTAGLILLPLLVGYLKPGFKAVSRKLAAVTLAIVLVGGIAVSISLHHRIPGMGNILTEYGILEPGLVVVGARPVILGPVACDLLTLAVLLSCAGCGLALWNLRGKTGLRLGDDPATPALVLGSVFAAIWFPAILFRSVEMAPFDRYLIPFLPLFAIPLLHYYQLHIGSHVSRWSWAVVILFAFYGVATTHDSFAEARARLKAARYLEHSGIPRTEITAGFEYDGWNQIEAMGYVNHWQLASPAGAYRPLTCTGSGAERGPRAVRLWYLRMMPAIQARYFVVLSRSPELADGPAGPVDYTTWLPPARRQIFTQTLPGGGYAGCR